MPKGLTNKQEAFCLAYTVPGETISGAYKKAYDASTMSDRSVTNAAGRVLRTEKVQKRIDQLRALAAKRAGLTLDDHLRDLKSLRNLSTQAKQYGPAVHAEVSRGRAAGLYIEKVEHSGEVRLSFTCEGDPDGGK